jgi:putative hydrolase of the HAD superfamily
MKQPVRTVIFDFGGVLTLPPEPRHWDELAGVIGGTDGAPAVEALAAGYQAHRDGFDRGSLSASSYWTAILAELGAAAEGSVLERLFELDTAAWTRIRTEVVHWAADLRAAGFATGILSNMPAEVLRRIEEQMDWIDGFRPQVYSCRLGLIKPEREIYQALLVELAAPPAQVLFLDDREENVEAARMQGLQAEVFTSLHELLPLVRRRYGLPDLAAAAPAERRTVR